MITKIISDIESIKEENYIHSFHILNGLAKEALNLIPDESKYQTDRAALKNVTWVMDKTGNTEGEQFESWLFQVFRSKREHALEALNNCKSL